VVLLVVVLLLGVVGIVGIASRPGPAAAPEPLVARPRPERKARRPAPPPPSPSSEVEPRAPAAAEPVGPQEAPIYGRVRGAERLPEGAVFVEGCGVRGDRDAPVDASGEFFASASPEPCQMRAWRAHGALRIPGEWVEVEPVAGKDVEVLLEVPTFEPAGMGLGFHPIGDAVLVNQVRPGSPALDAGIEAGDYITAIDGVTTSGMDSETFLKHGIGPAGTTVTLEGITSEGEPFEAVLVRRPIQLD
jgi:membrane-associated protease RseP (regulator of RpoE activity)